MAKKNKGQTKGFRFLTPKKQKRPLVHYFEIASEDARDAKIADAAYEAYLRDPSGARPLDELIAEWEARDAQREAARR